MLFRSIAELQQEGGEVIKKERKHFVDGTFWRVLPASEPDVDILIVRDTDSRIGLRERIAVDAWLQSGKGFHIIRDHPFHDTPILAGLWGRRNHIVPQMAWLIDRWKRFARKGDDQEFLSRCIYPRVRHDALIHTEFSQYKGEITERIPVPREGSEYLGCSFLANGALRTERSSALDLFKQKPRVLPLPIRVTNFLSEWQRRRDDRAFAAR